MAAAFVQKQTGRGAAVDSFALTFPSNVTAGNLLVGCYSPYNGSGISNATPTGGGTWSTTTAPGADAAWDAYICHAANATGGATTVTADYGSGFYVVGSISEYSGMETTSVVDVQTQATGSSTTPSTGNTGSTTQADTLAVACFASGTGTSDVSIDTPAATGYTNLHVEQDSNSYMGHSSDYKVVSGTGAQSAAWGTITSGQSWGAKIVVFKATGGAAGAISGTTALTFTPTGTVTGAGALAGTSALTFGAGSSTLRGTGALAGTSSSVFAGSSTLTGVGALAGASASVFGAGSSTLLGAGALAGTASNAFTTAGTLLGTGSLVGACALTLTPTATADQPSGSIAGTAALAFSIAAALTGSGSLAGIAALTITASLQPQSIATPTSRRRQVIVPGERREAIVSETRRIALQPKNGRRTLH